MVQGGMSCVKYILGVFNFAFFLSSIGIIVLCVRAIGMPESAETIMDVDNRHLMVMIAASILLLVISFLGCWGALRENHCMLVSYGVLLLIILLIEMALGVLAFVYSKKVEELAEESLTKYIKGYEWGNDNSTTNKLIDDLQKNVKCCGSYNYTVFLEKFDGKLPLSCCGKLSYNNNMLNPNVPTTAKSILNTTNDSSSTSSPSFATQIDGLSLENGTCSPEEAFKDGCVTKLWDLMVKYYGPLGGTLIAVAVIQLLGCILSCVFAHSIKQGYEVV